MSCERCGAPGRVTCDACYRETLDGLLGSASWRYVAAGRPGDIPGETLLCTVARERARLTGLGGADGARQRLAARRLS
jgi:hypothetical protein